MVVVVVYGDAEARRPLVAGGVRERGEREVRGRETEGRWEREENARERRGRGIFGLFAIWTSGFASSSREGSGLGSKVIYQIASNTRKTEIMQKALETFMKLQHTPLTVSK